MRGAVATAVEMAQRPHAISIPQQFENPANPEVHRRYHRRRDLRDTDGQVDILVSASGRVARSPAWPR